MKKLLTLLTLLALAGPLAAQTAAPTLIPFQGRLTDQNGVAYTSNQYTVVFQLYDQAVGGTLLWSERHEKVGVLNGMVNVFLGSIATLTNVTFSSTRYLGITVDGDNNPNTPDPEMVPRQVIIPAFWAKSAENATKLSGYDWTPLFGVNNPSGNLLGSKIGAASLPGTALVNNTVTSLQLATGAVSLAQIAIPAYGTNVGVGGVAISLSTDDWTSPTAVTPSSVTNLEVNLVTRGGPVEVYLTAARNPLSTPGFEYPSYIFAQRASIGGNGAKSAMVIIQLWSDLGFVAEASQHDVNKRVVIDSDVNLTVAPSMFRFIDTPPAGPRRYYIKAKTGGGNAGASPSDQLQFYYVRMVAREL